MKGWPVPSVPNKKRGISRKRLHTRLVALLLDLLLDAASEPAADEPLRSLFRYKSLGSRRPECCYCCEIQRYLFLLRSPKADAFRAYVHFIQQQ